MEELIILWQAACQSMYILAKRFTRVGRKSRLEAEFEGDISLNFVTSWLLYWNISISIAMAALLEHVDLFVVYRCN